MLLSPHRARKRERERTSHSGEGFGGTAAAAPTAVQAWQPCPLWELSPSHPILL